MSTTVASVHTDVLAVPLSAELCAYGPELVFVVLVTVRDTDGAAATGFTYTMGDGAGVVARMVDDVVTPALVGRHPFEWPRVRGDIAESTRRLGIGVFVPALSAVDIAMWDLRGIRAGLPLYALFGASAPAPVPIYGSGRAGNSLPIDELIRHTADYIEEGYPAVKVRAGARPPAEDASRLRALREAVGPDVRLMVDCNERLDLAAAIWLAARLADLGFEWLEEPLRVEDVAGYAALAARSPVAVATGEHLAGASAFAQYLRATTVAVYQPDAALCGGLTEARRIAELLQAHDHAPSYHSLAELHIHLAVAAPTRYVEDFPILSGVLAEQLPVVDGTVLPPERAGHGIRWDADAVKRMRVVGG